MSEDKYVWGFDDALKFLKDGRKVANQEMDKQGSFLRIHEGRIFFFRSDRSSFEWYGRSSKLLIDLWRVF